MASRIGNFWRKRKRGAVSRSVIPLLLGLTVIVVGSAISLASWRSARNLETDLGRARFETAGKALLARMDSDVASALVLARALAAASQMGVSEADWRALLARIDADAFGLPIRAVARLAPDGNGPMLWADLARPAPPGAPSASALDEQAPAVQEALQLLARDTTAQSARNGLAVLGARGEDGARILLLIEPRRWLDVRAAAVADLAAVRLLAAGPGREEETVAASAVFPGAPQRLEVGFIGKGETRWVLELAQLPLIGAVGAARLIAGLIASLALGLLLALILQRRRVAELLARRMTRELSVSHERYRRAIEASEDGIWAFEADSGKIRLSEGGLRLLGLSSAVRRRSYREVLACITPEHRHMLSVRLRGLLRFGRVLDCECRLLESNSSQVKWVRIRARAAPPGGELVGSISDVTLHRTFSLRLERYQAFLARVMDAVPVPLLVKDRDQRVLLANQAFVEFSRRAPESLAREAFVEPLGDLAPRLAELDRIALATGEPQSLSDRTRLPDGSQGFMEVSRTACVGPEGVPALVCTYFDLTAEQDAETRQRLARDFLLRLLELLPNGVFVRDAQGHVAMANPALHTMLGIAPGTLANDATGELLDRSLRESREEDARVLAGATVWRDVETLDAEGRSRSLRLLKAASRDAQGNPVVVGVLLDYTELIEAQAAERAASARVQGIYEHAPTGLAIVNLQGRFLLANPSFCKLVGRPESELRNMGYQDITPASFRGLDEAMMQALLEDGRCGPFDKAYAHADGHAVPVRVTGVVVNLGEGEEPVIWAMADDISREVQTQKALHTAERRWQFALSGSGDGVWDWDVRSSRVFYTPSWKTMLGHEENEVGDTLEEWSSRLHPDDQPAMMREVERHLVGDTPNFSYEVRMRHKDGHWIWILSRGQVVERAADSSPLRVIGTHTNIGALKQTQLELERSKAELEQHRDRLAELVHEQTADIIAARDAAEAANEAKDVFLANMSHELRTPLHAVLSFARLGESRTGRVEEGRLRDYFARIASGGERLLGLLNDLLDLAKLESGQMAIKPVSLDLAEVAREVLLEFEASLAAKRLDATLDVRPATPWAFADGVRIGQVLRNLLSNAIKFSPEGGAIRLHMEPAVLGSAERPVAAVELVVSDEGLGIPAKELEQVFEKFAQSSKTDTGAGGTGLGLAICREIVTGHGGVIFARNREASGAGVDFVVRLPAATATHAMEEPVQ